MKNKKTIKYSIEKSNSKEYKYVLWKEVYSDYGAACKGILHSNTYKECKTYRDKLIKGD